MNLLSRRNVIATAGALTATATSAKPWTPFRNLGVPAMAGRIRARAT